MIFLKNSSTQQSPTQFEFHTSLLQSHKAYDWYKSINQKQGEIIKDRDWNELPGIGQRSDLVDE